MQNLYKELIQVLSRNEKFLLEGQVSASLVRDKAYKLDPELVRLLFGNERLKQEFFTETNGAMIFNYPKFAKFITNKEFLPDSFTEFESNIGLSVGGKFLSENKEVVLSFPFKDCILEGGMDTEEAKNRKEIFYNQTLAPDDIHKLKSPKALKSWEKHTVNGKQEVKELRLKEDGTFDENFIIKGNNLLALYSLLPRYKGKIKLIYIDPPYNTGNDGFRYNDNFNHSTWLVFMKNRLEVARELLRDDGVIFVQCDDNEQAYLKVLMDEVFGRENFVSNIVWRKTDNQANIGNIARVKEYILVYSKVFSTFYFNKIELTEKAKKEYRYKDSIGYFRRAILLHKTRGTNIYEIKTSSGKILNGPWMVKESKFWDLEKENGIYWTSAGDEQPYGKIYLENSKGQIPNDFWDIEVGSNQQGALHMDQLFGSRKFAFPKPESLIQRIIEMSTEKNDIVLDYHLGSGTTCAVAHKMGRRYIGVEQMDYIEIIAVERLKKVVGKLDNSPREGWQPQVDGMLFGNGEEENTSSAKAGTPQEENFINFDTGGISKAVDWQGGSDFIYLELAKNNIAYLEKIESLASGLEAWTLFEELETSIWISYRVDIDKFKEHKDQFLALKIEDQKKVLRNIINYNHLYVNYEDMEDIAYQSCGLSGEDKALTTEFYEKKQTDQNQLL